MCDHGFESYLPTCIAKLMMLVSVWPKTLGTMHLAVAWCYVSCTIISFVSSLESCFVLFFRFSMHTGALGWALIYLVSELTPPETAAGGRKCGYSIAMSDNIRSHYEATWNGNNRGTLYFLENAYSFMTGILYLQTIQFSHSVYHLLNIQLIFAVFKVRLASLLSFLAVVNLYWLSDQKKKHMLII